MNLLHEWTIEGHLFCQLRSNGRFPQKCLEIDFQTLANTYLVSCSMLYYSDQKDGMNRDMNMVFG